MDFTLNYLLCDYSLLIINIQALIGNLRYYIHKYETFFIISFNKNHKFNFFDLIKFYDKHELNKPLFSHYFNNYFLINLKFLKGSIEET